MKKIIVLIMSLACVCAMFSSCSSEKESKIVTEDGKLVVKTYAEATVPWTDDGSALAGDLTLSVGKEEKTNLGEVLGGYSSGSAILMQFDFDGADLYFDTKDCTLRLYEVVRPFRRDSVELTPDVAVSGPCEVSWTTPERGESGYVSSEPTKIMITAKNGSDIVGAALLKLRYDPPIIGDSDKISGVYITLEKSVSFPKVKGKAQNITEEYLNEFFGE